MADEQNPNRDPRIDDNLDYRSGTQSQLEKQIARQTFKGKGFDRHREIDWNVRWLNTGQFVQFQYNNKLRRVLVLSPFYPNTSGNSVLTAIELNDIAFAPQKLAQLFRIGSLPRVVSIAAVDDTDFRYFAVQPDFKRDPQALYNLLQAKNKTINKNYKTYYMKKLQTGVMKMFNPIFSDYVINRMNILGVE
tara:strand:+ start:2054 stop:2626 length:573 start_codon:yes stop_codon:yes gene_type:complete